MRKIAVGLLLLVSAGCFANGGDETRKNALYVAPISMWIYSATNNIPVFSIAYERLIQENGWAFYLPLHAAYFSADQDRADYLLGGGLGMRKFMGRGFSGSYLALQTEYLIKKESRFNYSGQTRSDEEDYFKQTSVTQFVFGYKWQWTQFVLDLNIGGAFYIFDDEKRTFPIGGVNLGFPFNARTFGM